MQKSFELKPFDGQAPFSLKVSVELQHNSPQLKVHYKTEPATSIVLPEASNNPQQKDELWKKTCFEIFLKDPNSNRYWEWNFSPSGDWGFFSFEDERKRAGKRSCMSDLRLSTLTKGEIEVKIDFYEIPLLQWIFENSRVIDVHVSAVIEEKDGKVSYWSAQHPDSKPNFHDFRNYQRLSF